MVMLREKELFEGDVSFQLIGDTKALIELKIEGFHSLPLHPQPSVFLGILHA